MTVIGTAFVEVRPDTKGFGPAAEKGVMGSVTGIAKKAAAVLGGAFVAREVFDFGKKSFAAAEESLKISKQTEAVIKSTGGAAGVSAGQVGAMVDELSRKNTVDDEAIQQASNLLLTFTNVQDRVGKGNDVFTQANQAAIDMAAALGTDASGGAIQLGKALNDPMKGIAALTRVGVTFTDQQKDQIKKMQESGDMAGAQKVILAELSKEFGGSAAAQATATDKLKIAWGNFQEEIGARLMPVVSAAADFMSRNLPTALEVAGRAFSRIGDFIRPVVELVGNIINTLRGGGDIGKGLVIDVAGMFGIMEDDPRLEAFFTVIERVEDVLGSVVSFIRTTVVPNLKYLAIVAGALAGSAAIGAIIAAVTTLVGVLASPVVIIAALVGGIIYAYTHFKTFRDVVQTVVEFLTGTLVPKVRQVAELVAGAFGDLVGWVREHWEAISEAIGHVVVAIQAVVGAGLDYLTFLWDAWGGSILAIVGNVWDQVKLVIQTAIDLVRGIIETVLALINGDWGKAWDGVLGIVNTVWELIKGSIGNALGIIGSLVQGGLEHVAGVFGTIWDGIKGVVSGAVQSVVDTVTGLPGKLLGVVGSLLEAGAALGRSILDGLIEGISGAASLAADFAATLGRAMARFINTQIIDRINDLLSFTIDPPGPGPKLTLNPPDLPHINLASGALVQRTPGGVRANIGEGLFDEAVIPLPPGLLAGLKSLAGTGSGGQGFTVGQLVVQGATTEGAYATATETVRQLRAEHYRLTGVT